MDIHVNILLAIVAIITFTRIWHGWKVGMIEEVTTLGSIFVSVVILIFLLLGYRSYKTHDTISLLVDIILLLVVSIVYKIAKVFLSPAKILTKLPVINSLDQLVGAIFGFVEAVALLWALECLVNTFGLGKAGEWVRMSVAESKILSTAFDYNYIARLVPYILGKILEKTS